MSAALKRPQATAVQWRAAKAVLGQQVAAVERADSLEQVKHLQDVALDWINSLLALGLSSGAASHYRAALRVVVRATRRRLNESVTVTKETIA